MRQLISIIILSLLIISCDNQKKSDSKSENDSTSKSLSDYKELSFLENFDKISDTSFAENGVEPTHRITHLKRGSKNLILFNKIELDENNEENYSILDTLKISIIDKESFISIGYCEMKNSLPEEIIAIVKRTEKDTIEEILKAWKANSETKKIEVIKDITELKCLNEFYSGA